MTSQGTIIGGDDMFLVKLGTPSGPNPLTLGCPADITQNNDLGMCYATINPGAATAAGGCGDAIVVGARSDLAALNAPYPKGVTTITWIATDSCNNQTSCTQTITVNDNEKPTINCPTNVLVPCSVDLFVPVLFTVTATDNCDPGPVVTCTPPAGSWVPIGITVVTCTARDASENEVTCSFTITRAPLEFSGFLPPLSGADATGGSFANPIRTFKLSSPIPVKFTAACGGTPVLTGIHRLQVIKYTDATTAGDPIDAIPKGGTTAGDPFQLAGNLWRFDLDARATGMSPGVWLLRATLSDGSQHSAWIRIK